MGEQKKVNSGGYFFVFFFSLYFYNRNSFSKLPENLKYTFFCYAAAILILLLQISGDNVFISKR